MSQSGTLAGDRSGNDAKVASAGRGVLVLALFALIGIVVLQQLDNAPAATRAASNTGIQQAAAPVTTAVQNVAPTTLPARSPAEVKILVANGTGVTGIASKVAGRLQPAGYQLLKPGNTVNKETNSYVQYAPGYQAEASAVANSLGLAAANVQPFPAVNAVTDMAQANVVVIVGNDLANSPQTQAATPAQTPAATGSQSVTPAQAGSATTAAVANPALNGPLSQLPGVATTVPNG